ncbi:MAG TPA: PQQ-binding-like beta-propeller repeat protein [Phycisphaerae bacterium]|nr:PQQ-binding-like beta-propeller repeat protein [Phycisphaerae bacterium]
MHRRLEQDAPDDSVPPCFRANCRRFLHTAALLATAILAASGLAEDWPTHRHDSARSGVSGETLKLPLVHLWTYSPPAAPAPAWPAPQVGWGELPKLDFDIATHVAMAGDVVCFGSSVDNGVHALDAQTGQRRWTFFTEGPVRLAPTVAGGRVYAGSDDGRVYCLQAADGSLAWRVQPIAGGTRILGAGRLMSLWPVRTGVLVDDGVAYCGAGLFPARQTALVALDAQDGTLLWRTSQAPKGSYMPLAPQGYLLATPTQLYVPCGRAAPLAYARADGAVRAAMDRSYAIVGAKGVVSGGYGVLIDGLYYVGSQNVLHGYTPAGQHVAALKDTRQLVATGARYLTLRGQPPPGPRPIAPRPDVVTAIDRAAFRGAAGKGTVNKDAVQWTYARPGLEVLVVAGPHVLAGGSGEVIAVDAATGQEVWQAPVDGRVRGLAVANGRLVVSTENGRIHCFGHGLATPAAKVAAMPFSADGRMANAAALADAIAKDAGVDRGYALVLGRGASRLAVELATRTGARVHVAQTDPVEAAKERAALSAAGLYGAKVQVDAVAAEGAACLPYPPYFANLIVVTDEAWGRGAVAAKELLRVLKPCGGVLYAQGKAPDEAWAQAGAVTQMPLAGMPSWCKLVRGPLPGARNWTHQYADAGNTGSSDDQRVRGRPEVLWYGEPGPDKAEDRHRRSEAPLCLDGRVFMQGLRARDNTPILLSFDAYNGVSYWERPLPGASRIYILGDCGNLACSRDGLFVATGSQCQRLDLHTGQTRMTYEVPPRANGERGPWAYVGVEASTLVGSSSAGYQFSDTLFAYDLRTDKRLWRRPESVIRNSTIAIQGNRVFFVEHRGQAQAPVVLDPLTRAKIAADKRRAAAGAEEKAVGTSDVAPPVPAAAEAYVRTVVALDLATGKELWARDVELAGCGAWTGSLCLIAKDDVLVLCGVYDAYGRPTGEEGRRRAVALSATDGATLWDRTLGNFVRPVVSRDRVIARPKALDLRSGNPVMRAGPKGPVPWTIAASGACGQMSASAGMLFYRHGYTLMVNADTGATVMSFTGMRPGCLINVIPASGVIVQTEASSGCTCPHALQSTIVFVPPEAE